MLEFNVRNQEISRIDNFSPAEKSVDYLIAKFNFKTDDWNGATKRAIFRNVKSKEERDTILENDSCTVPWEVLVGSSEIEISVHGVNGTENITTDIATCNLNRTLSGGSASQEPSPTVYEQMVEIVKDTKDIAQSVRDDADNGEFNGPQGPAGQNGKSAYQYAVEGGYTRTEEEFTESLAKTGQYITKSEHEEQLLKAMVKVTTDKAPFHHITDSANMKVVDFGMKGKIEQRTTSGKNKLKTNNLVEWAISGVTFTPVYTNGMLDYVLVNGTATSTVSYPIGSCDDTYLSVDKIILNGCPSGGSASTYMLVHITSGTADIGAGKEMICSYLNNLNFAIRIMGGTTVSNAKFYPMVRLATETDATYEPYTNGPSPNSDYQQEIELAGVLNEETGRYEHRNWVVNRNLYSGGDVSGTLTANNLNVNIQPIPAGTYTFSANVESTDTDGTTNLIIFYYENGAPLTYSIKRGIRQSILVKFEKSVKGFRCYASYLHNTSEGDTFSFTDIMIEKGEVASEEYHPYEEQPFTLTSDRPLTKWDGLVKVDGVWYWDYKQVHLTVDGNENWKLYDAKFGFGVEVLSTAMYDRDGVCNQLRNSILTNYKGTNIIRIGYNNRYIQVMYSDFYDDTLEDKGLSNWKVHLNEHPLEIWTYSDTSELVPLLDEEQTLLNNLETYYGVTNVYNEQGCKIKLTYAADQELHWNQKLLEIQQAII